jgi:hypothetical protein
MSFECQSCGQQHEGLPMDIGIARPADFLAVPHAQRERRCKFTGDGGILDGRHFYIRGCVFVPVHDAPTPFAWGLWARVAETDYLRFGALYYSDGSGQPPFKGWLSVEDKPGYEGLDGHEAEVQLRSASERPAFRLVESEHRLSREQRDGIALHHVEEMLRELFPAQFK